MSVLPRSTRAVLVAMALLGAASPDPLSGQQDALGTERLTAFAKAHVAMNEVRDEFHRQIGEIHEEQGRERARAEFDVKIARTLLEHEFTPQEYDRIFLLLLSDGETRAAFDQILAQLTEAAAGG